MFIITKPWRYVFFRTMKWKLRDSRDPTPGLTAAYVMALLLFANLITLVMACNAWLGRSQPLPAIHRTPELYVVVGCLALAFGWITNRAWVADGRFARLVAEFESLQSKRNLSCGLLYWGYIVLSRGSHWISALAEGAPERAPPGE